MARVPAIGELVQLVPPLTVKKTLEAPFVQLVVKVAGVVRLSGVVLFANESYVGNVRVPDDGVSAVHDCGMFAVTVTVLVC